jgi:hypothetical protein
VDDDGFIGLPPGMAPIPVDPDSGTVRRERADRAPESEGIVFFPVMPGVPAPAVGVVEAQATEPLDPEELEGATSASLPRRHTAAGWQLRVGGRLVPVEGVLYLGRNPVATAVHPGAPVLAVNDERKSVSKTHAMLEVDADGLWVHDLDSTNGVWVIPAGGEPIEVMPGRREAVPAGAVLELGELPLHVQQL